MTLLLRYWPHLIILAVIFVAGTWVGAQPANKRAAKAELALSYVQRDAAQQLAEAEARLRKQQEATVNAIAAIEQDTAKRIEDAQATADAVVADLRAGNLRLRQHWQAERATDHLSDAATAERHAGEIAQLREEAAGRIVRVGAECDAQVKGLQDAYEALRRPAP